MLSMPRPQPKILDFVNGDTVSPVVAGSSLRSDFSYNLEHLVKKIEII